VWATSLTVSPLVRGAIAAMLIALAPLRAACARADTDERHEPTQVRILAAPSQPFAFGAA
jgi:hypothetical protein